MLAARVWIVVVALAGCENDSGIARRVSPPSASATKPDLPEPPGGPPSCADVGVTLGSRLELNDQTAQVRGVDVAVSGDTMRAGVEAGIARACRAAAWSHETRVCVASWKGNVLRERAKLSEDCPGTRPKP